MALNENPSSRKPNLQEGVYAAVLTPMHSDFRCNHKKLASHCFELIQQGCTGVALFGTTGEGPSFSLAERVEALEKLILEGFAPEKIILANGSSGIWDTVELGREALKHGCAAVLVAPPSFYKNVTDIGVLAFYREIIQKIGDPNLRILLYHIPQLSGVPISVGIIEALRKEFPEIVIGIKESEGNLSLTKTILETFPDFKVFVGNEKQIIESVHFGGAGTICGIANLYPELICSLYSQGKRANSSNPASIDAVFKALNGIPFIPAAKMLMKKRQGEVWHSVHPPLVPLDTMQGELFISALQEYGVER
jgi:4-hydroxy-tetrahydrodipicolinate synthase